MNEIKLLDNNTINKIAAGEVVERPSSVVKELVENAIDAGATQVTIEIRDGGINFIKITDNGFGIPKEQVKTAFIRHATSKIKIISDLDECMTLGFRGEALPSIASVSQVQMITKTESNETGTLINVFGGKITSIEEVGSAKGTTITVSNLFFNIPARKKFLKKPSAESAHVTDAVHKIALAHPEVSIKYINNQSQILLTQGTNDLKAVVFNVYGKDIAQKLIKVDYKKGDFALLGFIGKPETARANRTYGNLFINGRYIKSDLVYKAVEECYKTRLPIGKFPVFILNMKIPGDQIDVNVHPAKLEVRFHNEDFIYEAVNFAINQSISNENLIPEAKWDNKNDELMMINYEYHQQEKKVKPVFEPEINANPLKTNQYVQNEKCVNSAIPVTEGTFDCNKIQERIHTRSSEDISANDESFHDKDLKVPIYALSNEDRMLNNTDNRINRLVNKELIEKGYLNEDITPYNQPPKEKYQKPVYTQDTINSKVNINVYDNNSKVNTINNYKIVGQIFSTYWIVEIDEKMYFIDQHAAHERVLYERFLSNAKGKKWNTQKIFPSYKTIINEQEKLVIEDNISFFNDFGFDLNIVNERECEITGIPDIFENMMTPVFFLDLLDLLKEEHIDKTEVLFEKIAQMSCKAAIKGKDDKNIKEAEILIQMLLALDNPFTCPHGRPTIIEMTKYEIEKKFKRIQ